jgi:hypothetical protein
MILLMRSPIEAQIEFLEKEVISISPFQRRTCDNTGNWYIKMSEGSIFLVEGELEQYNKLVKKNKE